MNHNNPEARIADLERQLADAKAAAGPEDDVEQPPQFAHKRAGPKMFQPPRRTGGRNDLYWWIFGLIPAVWVISKFFGLTGLIVAVVVFAVVVAGHAALTRRGLDGEKIVGGIIGVLGGLFGVVTVLNIQFPSSVLWMSAIVCNSPYDLEYDVSHYGVRPGESSSSVDYACVSGEEVYDINDLMVLGLQGLLVALVLCPVVAVGFLVWRRSRKNRQFDVP